MMVLRVVRLEGNDDIYGRLIRHSGLFHHRECPECSKLQYMAVYLAPDPEASGYICPVCRGFYRLEKRRGRKETLKRIGAVMFKMEE